MAYCTSNAEVHAITGFQTTFTTATVPTLAQVDDFVSQCENEINLMLSALGITTVNSTYLNKTLAHYNAVGAAAYVLRRYGKADKQDRAIDCMVEWKEWCTKLLSDRDYQSMLISVNGTAEVGALTGTAETLGYVEHTSRIPAYGIDNIRP